MQERSLPPLCACPRLRPAGAGLRRARPLLRLELRRAQSVLRLELRRAQPVLRYKLRRARVIHSVLFCGGLGQPALPSSALICVSILPASANLCEPPRFNLPSAASVGSGSDTEAFPVMGRRSTVEFAEIAAEIERTRKAQFPEDSFDLHICIQDQFAGFLV